MEARRYPLSGGRRGRLLCDVSHLIHLRCAGNRSSSKGTGCDSPIPERSAVSLGPGTLRLQLGEQIGMPNSRPMPAVAPGVSELRVKGEDGIFRVFYYTASPRGVLVFHAFVKKTQRTPPLEMELARKRLKELLDA